MCCIILQSKRLALSGNIPGKDFPYSDHEGLEVVFSLNERVEPMPPRNLLLSGMHVAIYVRTVHGLFFMLRVTVQNFKSVSDQNCLIFLTVSRAMDLVYKRPGTRSHY